MPSQSLMGIASVNSAVLCRAILVAASVWGLCATARAQDAFRDAQNAFFQNDYKRAGEKAAEHMEARAVDPSSPVGLECRFYIGMGDYAAGSYEKAIEGLRAGRELRQLQNLRQIGVFYFADAYLRFGEELAKAEDEEKRKRAKEMFAAAEVAFNDYIREFPEGWLRPEAFIGLAKTYANQDRFADSFKWLNALIEGISQKPNPEPQDIAKIVEAYTLKGSVSKRYRDFLIAQDKHDEAQQFMRDFKSDLINLLQGQKSPAVFNDVAFLLGDVLVINQGFADAIEFYRQVKGKEEVKVAVGRFLGEERQRYSRARSGADAQRLRELDAQWLPYLRQLEKRFQDVSSPDKPDPLVTAFTQIAFCYLKLKRYHEAVIVSQRVVPFSKGGERKNALKAAIFAAVGARLPDDTAALLADYEKEFKAGDPELESIAFYIGQFYETSGRREKAREFYEKSLRDYPQGRHAAPNLLRLAIVNFHAERYQAALENFEGYVKAIGELTDQYFYYRGKTLLALGRWLDAAEMFQQGLELYPAFVLKEDAVYSLGMALAQGGKGAEAAEQLKKFLDDPVSARSPNRPNFMLQLGLIYQGINKPQEALAVFQQLVATPGTPLAIHAKLHIVKALPREEKRAALRAMLAPDLPAAVQVEIHLLLGRMLMEDQRWKDAIEELQHIVNKFPQDSRAADAQTDIAACEFAPIRAERKPGSLQGSERVNWESAVRRTLEAYEKLLDKFPGSRHAETALSFFTQVQLLRVSEKLATVAEVEQWFRAAAQRLAANPVTRARVLIALANVHSQLRPPDLVAAIKTSTEAFELAKDAFSTVESFNRYAAMLLEAGDFDRAAALLELMRVKRFDNPRDQQAAPFEAAWWTGQLHFLKEDYEKAADSFNKLNDAPWAPHYPDAQFGLACVAERQAAKPDDLQKALELFVKVGRSPGPASVRARAMLRAGHIYKKQSETASAPQVKADLRQTARTTFLQLVILYEREREACAEALFFAGQLWEADNKRAESVRCYQQAVATSPDSEFGLKSKTRLQELGMAPAPPKQP